MSPASAKWNSSFNRSPSGFGSFQLGFGWRILLGGCPALFQGIIDLKFVSTQNKFKGLDGHVTILGKGGNDVLMGTQFGDRIDGANGHDQIRGNAGNDTLLGGAGNDSIYGGIGNDLLDGGPGIDWNDRLEPGDQLVRH